MALSGTVKSYNPHKGWGFIECNGADIFLNKKDLKGICVEKGNQVQFNAVHHEKGQQANDVTVIINPDEACYTGEIKSFNPAKGFGFVTSEAFPGQDVFLLKTDLQGGYAPQGGQCKFKIVMGDKGPTAKEVTLIGTADRQMYMMKGAMGGMGMFGMGGMGGMGGKGMMGSGMGVWKPMFQKQGKGTGKSSDMTCWDLKKTGACPRGAACKFQH